MFGLENLDRNQKAVVGLGAAFAIYNLVSIVIALIDGSLLDELFLTYYFVAFAGLTGLYFRAKSYPDSKINNFELPLWIVFLVVSVLTILSGVVFANIVHLFSSVLLIFLILDRPGSKKRTGDESSDES